MNVSSISRFQDHKRHAILSWATGMRTGPSRPGAFLRLFPLTAGRNVMIDNKQSDFDRDKTGEGQDIEEAVPGWIKYPHLPWQQ